MIHGVLKESKVRSINVRRSCVIRYMSYNVRKLFLGIGTVIKSYIKFAFSILLLLFVPTKTDTLRLLGNTYVDYNFLIPDVIEIKNYCI